MPNRKIITTKLRGLFSLLNWYDAEIEIAYCYADKNKDQEIRLRNLLHRKEEIKNKVKLYFENL